MIAFAIHREVLKAHTWKVPRIYKNDNTARGKGGWQSPSQWVCRRRYVARQRGIEPPLEYLPMDTALEALS